MICGAHPVLALTSEGVFSVIGTVMGLIVLWLLLRLLGWIGRLLLHAVWIGALAAAAFWIWTKLVE